MNRRKLASAGSSASRRAPSLQSILTDTDRFFLERLNQHYWNWDGYESDPDTIDSRCFSFDSIARCDSIPTTKPQSMAFGADRYIQMDEEDENKPLNICTHLDDNEIPQLEINSANESLVDLLKPIYDKIVTEDKKSIYYHNFQKEPTFGNYIQFARKLMYLDLKKSTEDERLTFFINIYNIMMIHIQMKHGAPHSIWHRRKQINSTYYLIGGHRYALHSILHGILRGNRKGPGMLWKAFGKQDERLPLSLPKCEPLVHFAIITGCKTTPPLRLYSVKTIHEDLAENAKESLMTDKYVRVDGKKNIVYLSKTFKWFSDDFGGSHSKIIQWILNILGEEESDKRNTLLKFYTSGDYSVEYIPYDWSSNGKEERRESKLHEINN